MQIEISKWGNSLGIRIPKPFAEALGLGERSQARLELEKGQLIITPEKPDLLDFTRTGGEISLEALCKKMKPYGKEEHYDTEPTEEELWEYEE